MVRPRDDDHGHHRAAKLRMTRVARKVADPFRQRPRPSAEGRGGPQRRRRGARAGTGTSARGT
eukprot:scaffold495_cov405-Prasinococcus_capsulatus_cf.AAC.5